MAVHLTGNNVMRAASTDVASGLTAFTAAVWVNFRTIDATDDCLLLVGPDGDDRRLMIWRDAVSGFNGATDCLSVVVRASAGAANSGLSSATDSLSAAGEWIHVAVTGEAGFGYRLFVNGVADANAGYVGDPYTQTIPGAADCNLGYDAGASRQPDVWMAEHALWSGVALSEGEIAALAAGFSPLCLAGRLPALAVYQDLVRGANRPGIGPSLTAVGAPPAVQHPAIRYPSGAPVPGPSRTLFPRLAGAQCAVAGAVAGGMFVPGAAAGLTYPFAEAIS